MRFELSLHGQSTDRDKARAPQLLKGLIRGFNLCTDIQEAN